jgi:hypothetical protein
MSETNPRRPFQILPEKFLLLNRPGSRVGLEPTPFNPRVLIMTGAAFVLQGFLR